MNIKRFLSVKIITPIVLTLAVGVFFFYPEDIEKAIEQHAQEFFISGADVGYLDPAICEPCHSDVFETYMQNGMGKSFYRIGEEVAEEDWNEENVFYHPASDRYYSTFQRDGKFYQRRHQIGFDGKKTNVFEKEIHYVMGSGLAVKTFLHHTMDGKLIELPVAWYSEKGGSWAMNPGYDRPDHFGYRRVLDQACMFCHNGFAEIEQGADSFGREANFKGKLPEGIDCQRCHGPGRNHVETVQDDESTMDQVRASIINPGRLSPQRQLETCLSCHLQTTSSLLPGSIVRYDRGFYSFRPGEILTDYIVHFDHAPNTGYDNKFEILNAGYRLFKSACFTQSNGSMTCTTCHNPHDIPHGEEATVQYTTICRDCHGKALEQQITSGQHTSSSDCLPCHMPKRRTEDVVHAVMTDHYIQRLKPNQDLLGPLEEKDFYNRRYQGEITFFTPLGVPDDTRSELYLSVAQVKHSANLDNGIPLLEKAIEKYQPEEAEFYFELGDAYAKREQFDKAISMHRKALKLKPDLWPAQHRLGVALLKSGQLQSAEEALLKAATMDTEGAVTFNDLALLYREQGNLRQSVTALRKSLTINPDLTEGHNNLGGVLLELGDRSGAEKAFRNAIRVQPDFARAHHNLAKLLITKGSFQESSYHFEKAIQHGAQYAQAFFDYGLSLAQTEQFDKAQRQLESAVRIQPDWAEAHNTLGELLALNGKIQEAGRHFSQALELEPTFYEAHLNLGTLLAMTGNHQAAMTHLNEATQSLDPMTSRGAQELLRQLKGN